MLFFYLNEPTNNSDNQLKDLCWVLDIIFRGNHWPEVLDSPSAPEVVAHLLADLVDLLAFLVSGEAVCYVNTHGCIILNSDFL
jgi:hypothetical protein